MLQLTIFEVAPTLNAPTTKETAIQTQQPPPPSRNKFISSYKAKPRYTDTTVPTDREQANQKPGLQY